MWLLFFFGGGLVRVEWKKLSPPPWSSATRLTRTWQQGGTPHPLLLPLGMVWERWEAYGKGKSYYFGVVGGNPFKK